MMPAELRTAAAPPWKRRLKLMPEWLWFLVIFAGYIALMRWVLPSLGVPT